MRGERRRSPAPLIRRGAVMPQPIARPPQASGNPDPDTWSGCISTFTKEALLVHDTTEQCAAATVHRPPRHPGSATVEGGKALFPK